MRVVQKLFGAAVKPISFTLLIEELLQVCLLVLVQNLDLLEEFRLFDDCVQEDTEGHLAPSIPILCKQSYKIFVQGWVLASLHPALLATDHGMRICVKNCKTAAERPKIVRNALKRGASAEGKESHNMCP